MALLWDNVISLMLGQVCRLEIIYYFTYFSTVVPSNSCVFLSYRPFIVNTTFSTGRVSVEVSSVSWLGPRRRWEDNIRMDLEEISINTRNWVDSAQDRDYWRVIVSAALNIRVP